MKDQDGWKVLKAEVPAGLHLLPGLRADVPVQLLAREVLQEPGDNTGCLFTGTPNVQYRKENGLSLHEIFFGTAYLIGSLSFFTCNHMIVTANQNRPKYVTTFSKVFDTTRFQPNAFLGPK